MKAALLLLFAVSGYAQRTAVPPEYEVSAIKPNADGDFRYTFRIARDGAIAATGITLKRLMMTAYDLQGFRILGGPDWVSSKRWDVQAKAAGTSSDAQARQMLRTLLEDRFQLRTHLEKRDMRVYELTVGRKGSKLRQVQDGNTRPEIQAGNGFIRFTRATTATFASQLSYALARPVIDRTGLAGEFSFDLEWTPVPGEDGGPTTSGLPPGSPEQAAPDPMGRRSLQRSRSNWGFG
jgi:uncharacterized protein (TIGR03435 family)